MKANTSHRIDSFRRHHDESQASISNLQRWLVISNRVIRSLVYCASPIIKLKSDFAFPDAVVATLWHFMQLEDATPGLNGLYPGLGYGIGPSDGGLGI